MMMISKIQLIEGTLLFTILTAEQPHPLLMEIREFYQIRQHLAKALHSKLRYAIRISSIKKYLCKAATQVPISKKPHSTFHQIKLKRESLIFKVKKTKTQQT
jgi:hypothetical protein